MQFASFTSTAVKDRVNEAAGAIQQRMHRIVDAGWCEASIGNWAFPHPLSVSFAHDF